MNQTELMDLIQETLQNSGKLEVRDKDNSLLYTIGHESKKDPFWTCPYCDEDVTGPDGVIRVSAVLECDAHYYNDTLKEFIIGHEASDVEPIQDGKDPTDRLVTYRCGACGTMLTTAQIMKIEPEWNCNMAQTILGQYPATTPSIMEGTSHSE